MAVPGDIARLVGLFDQNKEAYLQGRYNETQLRREFIDPFFKALGWDVDNTKGWAEAYKEVIHEDAIRVGGAIKAPDYCFRIGGTRKFFLEAKKPAVNIKGDPSPAYQLRRYAWSAKLPLSILTDFEEFAVYDCRVRPHKTDKPSTARVIYLRYTDYAERWEEIASIFSREAVLKGSFDKYAQTEKRKRGTAEVDAAFLAEIEAWRENLARNIALRNPDLSNRELNYAVQITIDRIVFLRICEDRGIERYGQLMGLAGGADVYQRLMAIFRKADDRYNSGLFHFQHEKDRPEGPDELTPELVIDDKVLKDILRSLYYPDSPYEFSVLPAEILGHVYEQFLGKVITLTAGHRAKVEDKPEVKKAGGVYYTPAYIVDYIVEHTVGKLLEGASVKLLKTKPPRLDRPLRVLDPACGSGSFLLGAYQTLLNWYRDYYENNDPESWAAVKHPPIYQSGRSGWKLTTGERKRILLDHIYGVDIDTQAVEVTKLSLLLKVLEGENEQTINKQLVWLHERALPDLASNIKCGNSLIGPDFYQGKQLAMFDEEQRYRINAFDWKAEFPHIFKDGGFDAVISNPPYGIIFGAAQKEYLLVRHADVSDYESSQYFTSLAASLVNSSGYVSYIVPNTMFLNVLATKFRDMLLARLHLDSLLDLSDANVFRGATVRTAIPVLKSPSDPKCAATMAVMNSDYQIHEMGEVANVRLVGLDQPWIGFCHRSELISCVVRKINRASIPLSDILSISQGLIPYDKYRGHSPETIKNRIWHSDRKKDATYRRLLKGGDIKRYHIRWNGKTWISYGSWLAAPRKPEYFTSPRLLFREITDARSGSIHVCFTDEEYYNDPGAINCIRKDDSYDLKYLLGICASKLLAFYHYSTSPKARKGVFPKILVRDVRCLPIRPISPKLLSDKLHHDRMALLVDTMLQLHKDLARARTPGEERLLQRQIDATDRQIDELVYELYGLTDDEIKIVEEATGR